ncbi:unnamed protein product, partial [Closterium sp. NIES-53]
RAEERAEGRAKERAALTSAATNDARSPGEAVRGGEGAVGRGELVGGGRSGEGEVRGAARRRVRRGCMFALAPTSLRCSASRPHITPSSPSRRTPPHLSATFPPSSPPHLSARLSRAHFPHPLPPLYPPYLPPFTSPLPPLSDPGSRQSGSSTHKMRRVMGLVQPRQAGGKQGRAWGQAGCGSSSLPADPYPLPRPSHSMRLGGMPAVTRPRREAVLATAKREFRNALKNAHPSVSSSPLLPLFPPPLPSPPIPLPSPLFPSPLFPSPLFPSPLFPSPLSSPSPCAASFKAPQKVGTVVGSAALRRRR